MDDHRDGTAGPAEPAGSVGATGAVRAASAGVESDPEGENDDGDDGSTAFEPLVADGDSTGESPGDGTDGEDGDPTTRALTEDADDEREGEGEDGADPDLAESKGTALVTGASRGIGYELARLFAGTGHDVVLVARTESDLRDAADYFEERFGVEATVLPADLSEPSAPRVVYDACQQRGIEVTALVNNAGFGTSGPFVETDLDEELDELQVNVAAVTHLTKLFARDMADRGEGRVLNVGSLAGFAPGPEMAVYYATKGYVLSFSEALAEELADDGVTVTCLCPGPVDTEFMDRAGTDGKLINRLTTRDPRSVARAGYRGLMRGEAVVVPGLTWKVLALAARVLPRSVVRTVVRLGNASATRL